MGDQALSSALTAVYKFVVPAFLLLFPVVVASAVGLVPAAVVAIVALLQIRSRARLKWVELRDDRLFVSNFVAEELVPLDQIESVSESAFFQHATVTIRLRSPGRFGDTVRFVPYSAGLGRLSGRSGSAVEVLRAAMRGDRQRPPSSDDAGPTAPPPSEPTTF